MEYGADSAYVLLPDTNEPENVTLRALKHRHGEPVDISLRFERRLQRFTSQPTETDRAQTRDRLAAMWDRTPATAGDAGEEP